MSTGSSPIERRRTRIIELVVCGLLVAAMSIFALWKMGYLSGRSMHEIRMTDNTRTAYVAKNIVEGRGYTTRELPAFLIDFYDQRGKLHDMEWANADRFPFSAYAISALYLATGSTSYVVGVLLYNGLCFVAFLILLYWMTRRVWNDRWPALCALGFALIHPLTYLFLYFKDADMLLLVSGAMAAFLRYFECPPERRTWKLAVVMGTLLAWVFLARPNVGVCFGFCYLFVIGRRLWGARGGGELARELRVVARHEGVALAISLAWCLPFVVHSISEWQSPFFTANSIYQMPLGTRFAMNTDSWWKYSEPGQVLTLGTLLDEVPMQMLTKFTSSWAATLRWMLYSFAIELFVGIGLIAWLRRRRQTGTEEVVDQTAVVREQALRHMAAVVGFAVLFNFLVLPLFGYQGTPFRHYLSFVLPLIWLLCGQAVVLLARWLRPVVVRGFDRARAQPAWIVGGLVVLLAWNFGAQAEEVNPFFVNVGIFASKHWLSISILLCVIVGRKVLMRGPAYPRAVIAVSLLVAVWFKPDLTVKRGTQIWFPADTAVWDSLRQRNGLVMSFALQGEVNWVSGRRNIPAPELVMHAYSLQHDHKLEVEDVYIESAEAMLNQADGAFFHAAPGFESYARMQKFEGRLPGYEIAFHKEMTISNPKYQLKPRRKASTVYRLVDRVAARAMERSPDRIELGKVADVVYTAHGWGDYFLLDGQPVVASTDATRRRYVGASERPHEDTSVTFFLDARRPMSVDLEIYATHPTTLQFYWNLDLYSYDTSSARPAHAIGTYKVIAPGWQRIHLALPPLVTREGLNKLGFRVSAFHTISACPPGASGELCIAAQVPAGSAPSPSKIPVLAGNDAHVTSPEGFEASMFVRSLELNYPGSPRR